MRRWNQAPFWISASIQRTADPKHATRGLRHDMRVDHRRLDVSVAEQRLDGADVVAVFGVVQKRATLFSPGTR